MNDVLKKLEKNLPSQAQPGRGVVLIHPLKKSSKHPDITVIVLSLSGEATQYNGWIAEYEGNRSRDKYGNQFYRLRVSDPSKKKGAPERVKAMHTEGAPHGFSDYLEVDTTDAEGTGEKEGDSDGTQS